MWTQTGYCSLEAHWTGRSELRGKWVLRCETPALRELDPFQVFISKASYYSAVCLETARSIGWNWMATATLEPRLLS